METREILTELLRQAELPEALSVNPIVGRGFENEIYRVELVDGQQAVLRRYPHPRESERLRAAFLEKNNVPAPKLLACSLEADLCEFVPGTLLGDLIEEGRATPEVWRLVGEAFRRVHDVRFASGLFGEIQAGQVALRFNDPVAQAHEWLDEAIPGLSERVPQAVAYLPALHEIVDFATPSLKAAPSALGHGDINMWNLIVGPDNATLIDWDLPVVCDPAMEIALLDKHASLFNGYGIEPAFFKGYGQLATEPNTSLYRVVHTLNWAGSSDWEEFERLDLPSEQIERTRRWLRALLDYSANISDHIERLRHLVAH